MSYADVQLDVIRWAEARKIIQNSNIQAQARKTLEEAGELLEAATAVQVAGKAADVDAVHYWREKYEDAIADVAITLIIGCATADVDFVECLKKGYNEIKNRTGKLTKDGVFVKDV